MKLKMSEFRQLVSEGVEKIKESFEVGPDDEVDLGDPTIVHNNAYGYDDQETFTKMQNKRIRFDPDDFGDERTDELAMFGIKEEAPPGWEKSVKKMKNDPAISNPYALAWSMKNKGDVPHKTKSKK